MKFVIEAGAEVDIATTGEIKELFRREINRVRPIIRKPKGAVVIAASGSAKGVIDLGGPPAGRQWDVRHVTISGGDPTATPAGKGLIFIGPMLANAQILATDTLDPFAVWTGTSTLPADVTFSRYQATVLDTEHLFIVISGGTASANYVAHAQVLDEPEAIQDVGTL